MVGHNAAEPVEPKQGQSIQHLTLAWNGNGKNVIESRDPISRHDEQIGPDLIDIAYLAAGFSNKPRQRRLKHSEFLHEPDVAVPAGAEHRESFSVRRRHSPGLLRSCLLPKNARCAAHVYEQEHGSGAEDIAAGIKAISRRRPLERSDEPGPFDLNIIL